MVCERPVEEEILAVPLADLHRLTLAPPLSQSSPERRGLWQSGSREGGHAVLAEGGTPDLFSFHLSF